jgi:hypothetical protein
MVRGTFIYATEFPAAVEKVRAVPPSDRRAKAAALYEEFLVIWDALYKIDNIKTLTRKFCAALKAAGIVEKGDLPSLPRRYNDRKRKRDSESIAMKQETPPIIRAFSLFMAQICKGLRAAIDTKQCPMALNLLGFVIPLRSNDMNEARERAGGFTCDSNTHRIVPAGAKTSKTRLSIVGTIVNMCPSKALSPHPPYATVFLCDPEHYPLVEEAIAFVHDPEITELPCTTYARDFINKVPSGPQRGHEWSNGINRRMLLELDLSSSISDWGTLSPAKYDDDGEIVAPGGITAGLARAVCASAVEQGLLNFVAPLTNIKAVERMLGHVANSSQNAPYLRVCCSDPPKVPGVRMHKVTTSDYITLCDGTKITEGVCLVADDPPPPVP